MTGCQTCSSTSVCTKCLTNALKVGGVGCVDTCPGATYKNSLGTQCLTDCSTDGGRKKSSSGNLCVSSCAYTEYNDGGQCKLCSTITDCITCSSGSQCTECIVSKKIETTGNCVTTCANVISLADPKKCATDCSADGVINLLGTACIDSCPESNFVKNDRCYECDDTANGGATGCQKCSYSGTTFTCSVCDIESATKYIKYDDTGCTSNCTTTNAAWYLNFEKKHCVISC
eukprot:TRINITY_DN3419_c0_g1_i2.p2 TRINITY_DN3419_c0_g1~~TRINITY_DN3419_c0_g1_i2.p2  ORF type:complete len:230 (-),score=39.59 TRINITY_DN3419_c0_g1_i2:575-1264(-)